jgi:hypothetical protein
MGAPAFVKAVGRDSKPGEPVPGRVARAAGSRAPKQHRHLLSIALLALGGCCAGAEMAAAQAKLDPAPTAWTAKEFKKNIEARTNLSGAACTSKTPPLNSCVIVNDEKKYAQFFSIDGTTLNPGNVIRLVDDGVKGDPDAEGAAYDNGFFYITGSHGRGRNHPEKDSTPSYMIFRFPVDKVSGQPTFEVSEDKVVGVEPSLRLRAAIKDKLFFVYDQPLGCNGANIEGIAVKDGRMYLGFRGPSIDGLAFILSVDANAVFTESQPLGQDLKQLKLGVDAGIRDLASVEGGVLVLSGPVNDQAVTPSVFLWNEKTEALKKLAELAIPEQLKGHKAETLLVLKDAAGEPWRVLVMFDGPENGGPTEYLIPR